MGSTGNINSGEHGKPVYPSPVKGGRFKICCRCFVGSNPTAGTISVSSVGRAIVLLTIGRGFKSLTENIPISPNG